MNNTEIIKNCPNREECHCRINAETSRYVSFCNEQIEELIDKNKDKELKIQSLLAERDELVELMFELRDNCQASCAEDNISHERKNYRVELLLRTKNLLAKIQGEKK